MTGAERLQVWKILGAGGPSHLV